MRRLLLCGALVLSGCRVAGPLEHNRNPEAPVDSSWLSIPEQEMRARDRMSLPEFKPSMVPASPSPPPGYYPH